MGYPATGVFNGVTDTLLSLDGPFDDNIFIITYQHERVVLLGQENDGTMYPKSIHRNADGIRCAQSHTQCQLTLRPHSTDLLFFLPFLLPKFIFLLYLKLFNKYICNLSINQKPWTTI